MTLLPPFIHSWSDFTSLPHREQFTASQDRDSPIEAPQCSLITFIMYSLPPEYQYAINNAPMISDATTVPYEKSGEPWTETLVILIDYRDCQVVVRSRGSELKLQ
jgi:hypothetical protein